MKFLCIVPIFNEESKLKTLLYEITLYSKKNKDVHFLLINNGSTDNSFNLLKLSGISLISFKKNLGIGFALIQGLKIAIKKNFNFIIHLAGNGKMIPSQIDLFKKKIKKGYNFVNGSRFLNKKDHKSNPLIRIILIKTLSLFISFIYNKKITDATCGYRCFDVNLFKDHFHLLDQKKFYTYKYEYYSYGKALLSSKVKFCEVPVVMRYPKKNYSKIKPVIDWLPIISGWLEGKFDKIRI